MGQEPKNNGGAAGFGSDSSGALALFRRLSSQTVVSSFQTQQRDQFGGQVYNRSNVQLANLSTPLGANAVASGNRSTAVGAFANAKEDSSTALGVYSLAFGPSSVAIGDQAKVTGYRGIAIGPLTQVSSVNGTAMGIMAQSTAVRSLAIGNGAQASGTDSIAIGTQAFATGVDAIAIGNTTLAVGTSIAIGHTDSVSGTGSTAVGFAAVTGSAQQAVAIGSNSRCVGTPQSVALGVSAQVNGTSSSALGAGILVNHDYSVGVGYGATTTTNNQMMIGGGLGTNLDVVLYSGNLSFSSVGKGLYFKEGAATGTSTTYGRVTLSGAGTAIIYSTKISATSTIMLTPQNNSGTAGAVYITTSTAGVKATVASTNAADTRVVAWLLLESA